MDRDTAVRTWRDVCGNDPVMAMGVVTGRMLEEFARRIEAAACELCAQRLDAMSSCCPDGDSDKDTLLAAADELRSLSAS